MPKNRIEAVLRAPIEEYSCHVEFGTTLVSFEQHPDHVVARLIKTIDGKETKETAEFAWLVGADGGKGALSCAPLIRWNLTIYVCRNGAKAIGIAVRRCHPE